MPQSLHMVQPGLEKPSQWWELQSILGAWFEHSTSYMKPWIKRLQKPSSKVSMSSQKYEMTFISWQNPFMKRFFYNMKSVFHLKWQARKWNKNPFQMTNLLYILRLFYNSSLFTFFSLSIISPSI